MILLTVGTQLPFDRLVRTVDEWASGEQGLEIIAQIGQSSYVPRAMRSFDFIAPEQLRLYQQQTELCVAHAGMGSILTALEFGKPILLMPRDHERGEHRNGHQLATANRLAGTPGVYIASDEHELATMLSQRKSMTPPPLLGSASPQLLNEISSFLNERPARRANFLNPAKCGR